MMTIEEIQARKESQTFDCKSIQVDPKALAIPIVAMANIRFLQSVCEGQVRVSAMYGL